ncbi:hypothetical protein EJB05_41046 [Eragrostis curvula]|uniref:C3H1-type domain-containing protein n=1 Tax=Eragrostis curvula TaxID=38414 RepID=A0A5J9TAS9_9POAL|nr:hypothetical protein EJB05_41046 [Eragrostis curvula]
MNRRQELCRNFQRGSCKYGAQCRFVHASSQQQQQQQPKSNPFGFGTGSRQQQQQQPSFGSQFQQQQQQQPKSNPFGFGTGSRQQQQQSFGSQFQQQQQQQKQNPFGFGVQGAAPQSRNAPGPAKPFQNKWVRDPSVQTKQPEAATQPPAAHTACTDPESCRQQIVEDFKNETPLWKLTCYAHLRSGPCDIKGDFSFEELRARAYEEGRQGHPLQSIVERERNLQNAKLMEFTNFLNNPRVPQTASFPNVASVPEVKSNTPFGVSQNNGPPVFNSFSQIGASTNFGPGPRMTTGVPTSNLFGQSSQTSNPVFPAATFGVSEMKFGVSGPFGSQTRQSSGSLQSSSSSSFSFPKPPAGYQQSPTSSNHHRDIDKQSLDLLGGMMAPASATRQTPIEDEENENQDDSIWLKEKWSIGEIPLSEPPKRHISHRLYCVWWIKEAEFAYVLLQDTKAPC